MACVESPSANADSEMEEGEIVDEADVLSDISSEEEFLLRQRLKVLENYNNALERKEAKRTSGKDHHRRREVLCDLSDISHTNRENRFKIKILNDKKSTKPYQKSRRLKPSNRQVGKNREYKKKNHRKKKLSWKTNSDSTSDDEYIGKRHKLANAVSLNKVKHDTSTLKDRLTKMLSGNQTELHGTIQGQNSETVNNVEHNQSAICIDGSNLSLDLKRGEDESHLNQVEVKLTDSVENDPNTISSTCITEDIVGSRSLQKEEAPNNSDGTSDDDLEMLRQYALKTKSGKVKAKVVQQKVKPENKTEILSEDEDSDTAELRMICLKSALLKKAIEMKRKQKLQKRLSQSSNIHDLDIASESENIDNNTDIESVDMEIGSDGDDKGKIYITECRLMETKTRTSSVKSKVDNKDLNMEDELEDDEDLLRAKLLTSLSRNMPNLVDLNVVDISSLNETEIKNKDAKLQTPPNNVERKKFIIQLGESDSEGENEATKNLTKMHIKLSEQAEFQQKLDLFLKSTRMEVEKTKLPDVIQAPASKPNEKLAVKVMNHLPRSEQIEYKNLLKRVVELEKIKQARQSTLTTDIILPGTKDTLKPRNVSLESYKLAAAKKLEEKIALSRKRIAEESAKMLKLKEGGNKLSQRYKIVATQLRNIGTAIVLNKKQQRNVQNGLSKIRHQHQILLKSSPINYSNRNMHFGQTNKVMTTNKLQKENDPLKKEEYKNINHLKAVKVSVVNNLNDNSPGSTKLSIHLDLNSNKKTVKLPKSPLKDRIIDFRTKSPKKLQDESLNERMENKRSEVMSERIDLEDILQEDTNDYVSPLHALRCKSWEEDPNGVLCPFEFGGSCRDVECKYIHPKIPK